MKIIFVVVLFSMSSGLAASIIFSTDIKAVNATEISINRLTGDREYQGKPYTGKTISFHPGGQKATEESFRNGRRDGVLRRWFDTGLLAFESNYKMGKRYGRTSSWWINGNLRSQRNYIDDRAEGFAWEWYRDGNKFKKYHFTMGQPSGLQQGWRTNGKLFSNFEFRNGRAYGLRKAKLCINLEDEKLILN